MVGVTLITEQLRHRVPGGIGTYTRGLLLGLDRLASPDVGVRTWQSRLPIGVRTRLWDRGIGRVGGRILHAPSLAFPTPRRRLVVAVHDLAWRDVPETFPRRGVEWHERGLQRALRFADRIVVPSKLTHERLLEAGADQDRIAFIEYGGDHLPAPDHNTATRIVDRPFLLTVGTRQPRKNMARLAEAFARARPEFVEPLALVVVGREGWGEPDALGADVITTGGIDDAVLAALYARARAVAYVPLFEGYGLPPVEAMHAGVPVVTSTAVPSTAGVSLEVEATDTDAIAAALVAVVNDETTRARLIAAGTTRASQLTWRATAAAHVGLWTSLA